MLAIVCAMDMTNGGLYASLMQTYGTKEEAGAFVLTSIESGPLMSMVILGASGVAHFEPQIFIGAILPFVVGFALGNLDSKLRVLFAPGSVLMIPFLPLLWATPLICTPCCRHWPDSVSLSRLRSLS